VQHGRRAFLRLQKDRNGDERTVNIASSRAPRPVGAW
jgi:hypothetical protein